MEGQWEAHDDGFGEQMNHYLLNIELHSVLCKTSLTDLFQFSGKLLPG